MTASKKLILIMPPHMGLLRGFANGLISLANYVGSHATDIEVVIHDFSNGSFDQARETISHLVESNVDCRLFFGITTTTASYQSALKVATLIKEAAPKSIVIFGGHHVGADVETVLAHHADLIDAIVIGEGEKSLCELLTHFPDLGKVPGIAFRKDNRHYTNPQPPVLTQQELDDLPVFFKNQGVIGVPGKFDHVTYVSARGCPHNCSFCAVGNEKIRYKSVSAVKGDIERLIQLGYCNIAIEDNFFAHSLSRTHDLCLALKEVRNKSNGRFRWDCQTRVESMTGQETIDQLSAAGCDAVYLGVESFNADHLAFLNKTSNPESYLDKLTNRVVPALLDSPVSCYINLQFGLPGETSKHHDTTRHHLAEIGMKAAARNKVVTIFPQLYVVYPGTALFRQGVVKNQFPSDVFESFTKWEFDQEPVVFWLGEHFAHGTGGIPQGILEQERLKEGEYRVDADAVMNISGVLKAITGIKGISVFNYGQYIIKRTKGDRK